MYWGAQSDRSTSVLPLICKQKAIALTGPQLVNNLMPLTPLFAYGLGISAGVEEFHLLVFVLVCLLALLLLAYTRYRKIDTRRRV